MNTIQYITIATLGNASDFGDLSALTGHQGGMSSRTRAVFAGGNVPGSYVTTIEYVQIMTTGDAIDFGDLPLTQAEPGPVSNGHGGL